MNSNSSKQKVIVGLGQTGLSCAKYLASKNVKFSVVDSRKSPPGLADLKKELPEVEVNLGQFYEDILLNAEELIVSPGVDLRTPELRNSISAGVPVTGDIDIFAKQVKSPIIAVTGSNGKSTVVSLLGKMAEEANVNVAVAGNIGKPVLELLTEKPNKLYILELSSFQLETTHDLKAEVATVLNVSADHLDRYDSMAEYIAAKQRIFQGCKQAVVNRDDKASRPVATIKNWSFGLSIGKENQFGLINQEGNEFLGFNNVALLGTDELKIIGQHNISNALAALALGYAAGLEFEPMVNALKRFPGLSHRCQWIAEKNGVNYYNDSKGTNVGASVTAIRSLNQKITEGASLILIAGGVGKGADFNELAFALKQFKTQAILFGEDAGLIAKVLSESIEVKICNSLDEAVTLASKKAKRGDIVLLSPACASFDMFRNFEHRGEVFANAVRELH